MMYHLYLILLLLIILASEGVSENTPKDDVPKGDFFEKIEKEKEKYPYLYIPKESFQYRKIKIDAAISYVTSPVRSINSSSDARSLIFPEIQLAFDYWIRKNIGIYADYSAGFILTDSGQLDDFFYYPTTINVSLKYKAAFEYSIAAPFFNIELGLHYHDLNIEKKEGELLNRVYKGVYLGIGQKIPLSKNIGFLFKFNYMPYLISREFDSLNDLKDKSIGFHFLASTYFTTKTKLRDDDLYRLKVFLGISQRDYFTDVKNSTIDKKRLNQKYSTIFLIASQEL